MPLSMYRVSIPVLVRGLGVLSTLMDKAAAHEDGEALVGARLFDDMLPLSGQVQRASDTAKFVAERLTGEPAPRFADEEATLAELKDRIARTIAHLRSVSPDSVAGSETREVVLKTRSGETTFTGEAYLLEFALPNFFFHVTTAYDILRHRGVVVGKRDYLG